MRKSQFFIATVILVSLAISITAVNLYVPKEINVNQANIADESFDNILFVKQTLKQLINYFRINWLLPYERRTKIIVDNDFRLNDYTISANIDLPDNAYINSLRLVNEKKEKVPFGIEWSNNFLRQGVIYFQASSEPLEKNYYFLYYNTAPGTTIKHDSKRMYYYGEDADNVWVRTSNYYALINKSAGGRIDLLNISGSDSVLNHHDHFIDCNSGRFYLSDSINHELTITPKDYYLKLEFTGSRFVNETYKVTELFFPDEVLIIDEMDLAANTTCSIWSSETNLTLDYFTSVIFSNWGFVPNIGPGPLTYLSNNRWIDLYGNDYSVGLIAGNESPTYGETADSSTTGQFRFINLTNDYLNQGEYSNNFTLVPLVGGRFNSTKKYLNPSISTINERFTEEFNELFTVFNNYFNDINTVINYEKSVDTHHETKSNLSDWYSDYDYRDLFYFNSPNGLTPLEASILLDGSIDPDSIALYHNGLVPHQLSTSNYHDYSSFGVLNNSEVNNSLLVFNPDGQDFELVVNKIIDGSLGLNVSLPNGSLINYFNINTDPYTINLNDYNQSGFFALEFNGSAAYELNASLPKMIAKLPVELSNDSPVYLLFNESMNSTDLSITTYSSINQNFTLFNPWNETLGSVLRTSPGTSSINVDVVPCKDYCSYRLEVSNNSPFKLSSNTILYASTSEEYLINPLEPELVIINLNDVPRGKMYVFYDNGSPDANASPLSSDLILSINDNLVNNSQISFDFDDLEFIHEGNDWINGRGWVSCTNECVNSFSNIRFVEQGSERVVVWANTSVGLSYYFHFYPNTSYFKIRTLCETKHSFGPDWMVNNTDDTQYYYKDSIINSLGDDDKFVDKYYLKGPKNFITKGDEENSASIIFNTNVLEANNSIKVNDTSIIINALLPSTYKFVINGDAYDYLTGLRINDYGIEINYTQDSTQLSLNGQLIS